MKKIFLTVITFLFINYSCKDKKSYFNGTISVENDFSVTDYITGEKINLEDIYTGYMSVYDSVITFVSSKYQDKLLYMFSLNSGNLTGSFFQKGQGPGDFYNITHTEQYVSDNSVKLWVRDDLLAGKNLLFNITRSIQEQTVQLDSTVVFDWRKERMRPFAYIFYLKGDHIMVKNQPEKLYNDGLEYIPGNYHLYEQSSQERLKSYIIYTKPLINKKFPLFDMFFYSLDRIKPDKTKIVMGMTMLAQINILDIETGEVKGFRLKDTPDFDYLTGDKENLKFYYIDICVDDKYIYGLYSNAYATVFVEENKSTYFDNTNELHIFDWNGNCVRRVILDREFQDITIDPVHKLLYAKNNDDEDVYRYQIGDLTK